MNPQSNGMMMGHLVEDLAFKERTYWWHRVRRDNLLALCEGCMGRGDRILEIGCGTGANLRALKACGYRAQGLELDPKAVAHCGDLAVVRADAQATLPFLDASFQAVVLLDVMEHLANTQGLVHELERVLVPGGRALVMVPADPALWSYWDEMLGHCRRYTPASLKATFPQGWRLEQLRYSFSHMYWPVRVIRFLRSGRVKSVAHTDFTPVPSWVNSLLVGAGRVERMMSALVRPPFGTTLTGLWRKAA